MANKGSYLAVGDFLSVGDYLVSEGNLFYAIMQGDGTFDVYRGAGPQDADKYGAALWTGTKMIGFMRVPLPTGAYYAIMQSDGNLVVYEGAAPPQQNGTVWAANGGLAQGAYYATIQDDGNLVVYQGASPAAPGSAVWASGNLDPIASVVIQNVVYEITNAKILSTTPDDLYSQTVSNNSSTTQSSTINGSASTTETSGWSDSLAVKVGASASFQTGIPFIAKGEVTVSLDVTNSYTWNGSVSNTKTWGFSTPVSVPPDSSVTVAVSVSQSSITVPYTLTGVFTLQSGYQVPGTVHGTYTGVNSHDLVVSFNTVSDKTAKQVSLTSKPLQPTSVTVGPPEPAPRVPAARAGRPPAEAGHDAATAGLRRRAPPAAPTSRAAGFCLAGGPRASFATSLAPS